jgi:hypothetical protein
MRLRDFVAGGLLAAFLVACSAASPSTPDSAALSATAAAGVDAATTAVPGLESTAAAGMDAAATAAPGLQATAESVTGVSADELAGMLGESVTLNGQVTTIMSPMLFQVSDAAYGEDVLVLAPTGSMSIGQGQQVEITGVVQTFELAALEQSMNVDIDDSLAAGLDGRTVVVAQQVNTTGS